MALEPLGSIMTVQAQPVQKQVEVKPVAENKEVSASNQAMYVDANTKAISPTEEKENENNFSEQQHTQEHIKKTVEKLNKNMSHSEAVFGIHEGTNRVTIKIVDKNSKEVIKELPPEKTLDMIAKAWELAGILVDEKR